MSLCSVIYRKMQYQCLQINIMSHPIIQTKLKLVHGFIYFYVKYEFPHIPFCKASSDA